MEAFKGAPWFKTIRGITPLVVGAGGTGSWMAFLLARAGVQTIVVMDDDIIEYRNMSGQFFKTNQIGKQKVMALAENIKEFTGIDIYPIVGRYGTMNSPLMVSCVDNMETRKIMFNKWLEHEKPELFVDIRLDFEQSDIFLVTPETAERYRETLFDDSEVEEPLCAMKQTTHIAFHVHRAMEGIINYYADRPFNFKTTEVTFISYVGVIQ